MSRQAPQTFRLFLCTFSGEDVSIIRNCPPSIENIFAFIGLFVILMFIGCFVSAYDFFNSLFEGNQFISIPIGLVWATLVINMYLLLLYTVSPTLLPSKKNRKANDLNFFTASMFFRITFMSLLAIIIAQPLNVIFLSKSVNASLQRHIQEEKTKMVIIADSLLVKNEIALFNDFNNVAKSQSSNAQIEELNQNMAKVNAKMQADVDFISAAKVTLAKLQNIENHNWLSRGEVKKKDSLVLRLANLVDFEINSDQQFIDELENIQIDGPSKQEFDKYKSNLRIAISDKLSNYSRLDFLLSKSNFYIKRIQLILYENHASWMITLGICLLFLFPIYYKYKVREKTEFYSLKIEREKNNVIKEYEIFKKIYSQLLQENIAQYNFNSLKDLETELIRLKKVCPIKYAEAKKQIEEEYRDEVVSKYEYWADNPFRTVHRIDKKRIGKEEDFIKLIYAEEN